MSGNRVAYFAYLCRLSALTDMGSTVIYALDSLHFRRVRRPGSAYAPGNAPARAFIKSLARVKVT